MTIIAAIEVAASSATPVDHGEMPLQTPSEGESVHDQSREVARGWAEVVALANTLAAERGSTVEAVSLPTDVTAEAAGIRLARLVMDVRPTAVVAMGSDFATEAMAHAAAVTNLPLACNCVSVTAGEAAWSVTRARGGGVLLEDAALIASTKLVTLSPGSIAVDDDTRVPELKDLPKHTGLPVRSQLSSRDTTADAGVSLATAPVVVSGGRGVGSAAGFGALEDLAGLIGGAVGCSRVVTNNGWRPHSDQVGQTGTKVSPDVYIAAGISGATQHWAGCMSSKTIIAINTDAEAPMVSRADYAVIGDAVDVVQAVADELRSRQRKRP